ncbi:MAG: FAD-dependent oxidoreductase, partial [Spirochaetes bacterium]|nr:FAD-dependent oxidoreductase [Spirochaetota bacterium]
MKQILIIGGVAAGATAAARARRLDESAEISILEAGNDVSFANCGLPYFIGGEIAYRSSLILQSPQSFYDQYRVQVHTATEATKIDRANKTVSALNKQDNSTRQYSYDVLILAQGGKPIVPPLPGMDQDNVFQLWTLDDMDAIDNFIKTRKPTTGLVVGGGFIGLEMVEALAHRGLKVNVVEMADQIMPNLEKEIVGLLMQELEAHDIGVHVGKALSKLDGTTAHLNDGSTLQADFVLMSVGVRPTLQLAKDAGLTIGTTGALQVDEYMQTSDPAIFAAGDMAEIRQSMLGKQVRVPLAGPANRQGRIVAENALGARKVYNGTLATSIVKLFDAQAGGTGLNLKAAKEAGFDAEVVVTHKYNHTSYYPGATPVTLMLVYDRQSGRVLGAQAAGFDGADKRIDVIATAIAGKLTLQDLAELDFAYAPPFDSPNGPVNMSAFTAQNRQSGFSPAITAAELEDFAVEQQPVAIDVRDPISFQKNHVPGSVNIGLNQLRDRIASIPEDETVLIISDDGQKGHVAVRMLIGAGYKKVYNLSGGFMSVERYARAGGYSKLAVRLNEVEKKSLKKDGAAGAAATAAAEKPVAAEPKVPAGPVVIDVRTPME